MKRSSNANASLSSAGCFVKGAGGRTARGASRKPLLVLCLAPALAAGCECAPPATTGSGGSSAVSTSSTATGMGGGSTTSGVTTGTGGSSTVTTSSMSSTGGGGAGGAGGAGGMSCVDGAATSAASSSGAGGGGGGGVCGNGPGSLCWAEHFKNKNGVPSAVATDAGGNIVLTGTFSEGLNFGNGPFVSIDDPDIFMTRFTPAGAALWSKRIGCVGYQGGAGIVDPFGDIVMLSAFEGTIDFGGGPLTSNGSTDIALAKFDGNGNYKWSKSFGDAELQLGGGIAVDSGGNIVIDGLNRGIVNLGGEPLTSISPKGAIVVAKFDPDGAHIWSHIFQNTGNPFPTEFGSIAIDAQSNVVLAGSFRGMIDFGLGPMVSTGQQDVFVVKIDPAGNAAWAKRFGDGIEQEGAQATVDPAGNILIVGNFNGSLNFGNGSIVSVGKGDIFLAKIDPSGNEIWSKRFGDITSDNLAHSQRIIVDATGNPIIYGNLVGNADFGTGFLAGGQSGESYPYAAKFDKDGTCLWAYVGNSGGANPTSIGLDLAGNVILTGQLTDPTMFAGANLLPMGLADIYLLKLSP